MSAATMTSTPSIREENLQKSIYFLQEEHSKTLKALHLEIQNLQKRCADLTFQLMVTHSYSETDDNTTQTTSSKSVDTKASTEELRQLREQLQRREQDLERLEQQLKAQERCFTEELRCKQQQLTAAETELEAKSDVIATLMTEVHRVRRLLHDRRTPSSSVEEAVPSKPLLATPLHVIHLPTPPPPLRKEKRATTPRVDKVLNRPPSTRKLSSSVSASTDVIPDPTPFLRIPPLVDSELSPRVSRAELSVLPPIAGGRGVCESKRENVEDCLLLERISKSIPNDGGRLFFRRNLAPLTASAPGGAGTMRVETLAVDQIKRMTRQKSPEHKHAHS